MKIKPEYITDDYQPSDDLIQWCNSMGIVSRIIEIERRDFIFWHKTKKKRRSNFNLAFRNWLKRGLKTQEQSEQVTKKGSQSYGEYKPLSEIVCDRELGRDALKKLKGIL